MILRVLVVDDSRTVRKRLCEVLTHHADLQVIGEASDGKAAIELCQRLRPDVITMDMMMPVMTGLAATEYIMAHCPTPILVVSASLHRGELFRTYDALAAGAVDVLDKPRGDDGDDDWELRFVAAVRMVARIRVITHPRARLSTLVRPGRTPLAVPVPVPVPVPPPVPRAPDVRVIALGASTGGPGALVEVLRALRAGGPATVLFVLHIGEMFGRVFAEWLAEHTRHDVRMAQDQDSLVEQRGRVLMAPPGLHLLVERGMVRLGAGPERHSCRPSIDVLFEALAEERARETAACLLTGMGRDGAAGLLALRRAGAVTLAQDEATSVVYGMPREAALLDAAERVLPLGELGPALAQLLGTKTKGTT